MINTQNNYSMASKAMQYQDQMVADRQPGEEMSFSSGSLSPVAPSAASSSVAPTTAAQLPASIRNGDAAAKQAYDDRARRSSRSSSISSRKSSPTTATGQDGSGDGSATARNSASGLMGSDPASSMYSQLLAERADLGPDGLRRNRHGAGSSPRRSIQRSGRRRRPRPRRCGTASVGSGPAQPQRWRRDHRRAADCDRVDGYDFDRRRRDRGRAGNRHHAEHRHIGLGRERGSKRPEKSGEAED